MSTPANVFTATGRRKTSTARIRLTEGTGKLTVNGRSFETYFVPESFAKQAALPLTTVSLADKYDVSVNASGGGLAGQAGAVSLGIARALQKLTRLYQGCSARRKRAYLWRRSCAQRSSARRLP
jgi:small subunit ribosomal protein S9